MLLKNCHYRNTDPKPQRAKAPNPPSISIIPAKVMVIICSKYGPGAHGGVGPSGGKHSGVFIPWAHEGQEGAILLNAELTERAVEKGEVERVSEVLRLYFRV